MNVRLYILVVFAVLSGCGGGGSSAGGGSVTSDDVADKEDVIIALGDSIGIGYRASIAFPNVVSQLTGLPVVNSSSGGISAEHGILPAQRLITQYNPKFLIALLGTNNESGANSGVNGAVEAMESLAQTCVDNKVICVFGTLPPITYSEARNVDATNISKRIRKIKSVRIADNNAAMDASHIGYDGIHPNDAGQWLIGEMFAAQLR